MELDGIGIIVAVKNNDVVRFCIYTARDFSRLYNNLITVCHLTMEPILFHYQFNDILLFELGLNCHILAYRYLQPVRSNYLLALLN